uniref:Mutant melanocortin receptor 1 n=1 Tax=Astyanax mexicanus TaxID=7994 RepID=C0L7K7_ASTMX|nr:mutant melanocortin receptor 1 [Astyanax mexicanus]
MNNTLHHFGAQSPGAVGSPFARQRLPERVSGGYECHGHRTDHDPTGALPNAGPHQPGGEHPGGGGHREEQEPALAHVLLHLLPGCVRHASEREQCGRDYVHAAD